MSACLSMLLLVALHNQPVQQAEVRVCVPGVTSPVAADVARDAPCVRLAASTIRALQHQGILPGSHETISYRIISCSSSI